MYLCPSVEFLMRHSCLLYPFGAENRAENPSTETYLQLLQVPTVPAVKNLRGGTSARGLRRNRGNKSRGVVVCHASTFTGIGVYARRPYA
jgi:hypothetical protein